MTLERLLWKIPQYRRRKVIEIVDTGEEALRELPVYDDIGFARYLLDETVKQGIDDVGNYLRQHKLLRIFNKYQLAEKFINKYPDVEDQKVIALVGNLYSDYVAGNMWADGMNPNPPAAREKLHQRIDRWTHLLSYLDPSTANTFRKSAHEFEGKLR